MLDAYVEDDQTSSVAYYENETLDIKLDANIENTLKNTITNICEKKFHKEAAVSQGAVLPILRRLGWDVEDTGLVYPEYAIGRKSVDYALFCQDGEKPIAFIEVKKDLGKDKKGVEQLFGYVNTEKNADSLFLAVLTDGRTWRFYEPFGQGEYRDRQVNEIDIRKDKLEDSSSCLMSYLSFSAVNSGDAKKAFNEDYAMK